MHHKFVAITALLGAVLFLAATFTPRPEPMPFVVPEGWPAPAYDFARNPLTREGIALGRRLFYDPILSRDSTISCASCHLSFTAFTHVDHALSHGIKDRIGRRNASVLINLAWSPALMWDGSVHHLDFQALAPLTDSTEMDHDLGLVLAKLRQQPTYRRWFWAAFGDSTVTGEHFLKAIAQFELTLVSANAKYDRVRAGRDTFSTQENIGYGLFQRHCAQCHAEPLFSNGGFAHNGLPIDSALMDWGRANVTRQPADRLRFKVPTLRNVEFSYPYMHDGRFRKLRDVLQHYSNVEINGKKMNFTPVEKADLTAFLLTLTDKTFLFNPEFSFPPK
jgi:cytochrome c peroxidase